jgi:hypothetical protein
VEVLITTAVLAMALLTEVSTSIGMYGHSRRELCRSDILQVSRQFMERLRGDDDPAGMYSRLAALMEGAVMPTGGGDPTVPVDSDDYGLPPPTPTPGSVPNGPPLEDGRPTWLPQVYYPDFVHPTSLHSLGVLVDVPATVPANDPYGATVLREDMGHPGFALPADLNGDGTIDSEAHSDDHVALPVIVTFRWKSSGNDMEQFSIRSWIRIRR